MNATHPKWLSIRDVVAMVGAPAMWLDAPRWCLCREDAEGAMVPDEPSLTE